MMFCEKKHSVLCLLPLVPICLTLDSLVFLRLARWQEAVPSQADLYCRATLPSPYHFPIHLLFCLFCTVNFAQIMRAGWMIRTGSRIRALAKQLVSLTIFALVTAAWLVLCTLLIARMACPLAINWNCYDSVFFLNTQQLREEGLITVFCCLCCTTFFSLFTSGLFCLLAAWSTQKRWLGMVAFSLLYLWDAASLKPANAIYYLRFSLDYANWVQGFIGWPICAGLLLCVCVLLILLFRQAARRDVLS